MEVGIDSFASHLLGAGTERTITGTEAMRQLLERIERADQVGLDVFGIGEHHRAEYLDSAPAVILAAAAARTTRIRLTSAVTVLSAADPVRVFQEFATLDLISQGRAEMVVGRGSSVEAFPLFGFDLNDYDELFTEKLGQGVYPRPHQSPLPIWLGVGGTPESFARAGTLGLPLMVAIIGGDTHRFRPLVDLYREAGRRAGHAPERLRVGLHSLGYVAPTTEEAIEAFYPGYARTFSARSRERGGRPVTREQFDAQTGPLGALLLGSPEDVAAKIIRHGQALGGISRVTFQMDVATLPHAQILRATELLGERVAPLLR
jgi:alkanesulfonate monooxygenase SsuD/methylene tetrahydromethanopterin reductase-like flavin-dependent oxidoreductase (luciferase family)